MAVLRQNFANITIILQKKKLFCNIMILSYHCLFILNENFGIFSVMFCNKITEFPKKRYYNAIRYYNMKELFFSIVYGLQTRINTDIFAAFKKRRIIRIFLKKSIDKLDFFIYNLLGWRYYEKIASLSNIQSDTECENYVQRCWKGKIACRL